MTKYKLDRNEGTPEVSTASLPDIVFILLFFFMTVTVMKDDSLKVINDLPSATEVKRLERKDRIVTVYIGRPRKEWKGIVGEEPKIQVHDKFITVSEVGSFVLGEIEKMPEDIRPLATVSLKVDKKANMGLISDVKQELRKVNALKINYTTLEGDTALNFKKEIAY